MALRYLYAPIGYEGGKAYGVLPNVANADFAFIRASGATKIIGSSDKAIDKGESISSNNIAPSNFSSGWEGVGSGMTLSTGAAVFDNDSLSVGAYIKTSSSITQGKVYRIIFEVTSFTSAGSGGLYYYSDSGNVPFRVQGVGTYEYTFKCNKTRSFVLNSYTGTALTVGSVSLKEITTTNLNTPRLDYTDYAFPTLLVEPERTNLIGYSDRGIYGNTPTSETQTIAPDGTNTATIPTPNEVADRYEYVVPAGTYATDQKLTYSWYRKRLSTPIGDSSQTGDLKITGFVNCSQVGSTTQIGSDIGGYDRFSTTFNITDGALESKLRLYFGYVVGAGNSSVAYFGHQLELGEYATSYIPTHGTTEIREAETGLISGDLSSYINSSEGVLEIKAKTLFNGGNDVRIGISDGTSDNRISLVYGTGANSMVLFMKANGQQVLDGGTVDFKILTGSFPQTDITTFKIKWKSGDIQVKVNDTTIALSQTDTFTMVGLDQVRLDGGVGSNIFEGNVQYIKVYDTANDF